MKNARKTFGIIAILTLIAFSFAVGFASCDNGTTNGGSSGSAPTARFEGNWFSVDPSNSSNFNVFTFTDNTFTYSEFANGNRQISRNGTFTFTAAELTLRPAQANTWEGYTQTYTLSEIDLLLSQDGAFIKHPSLTEFITLTYADSVAQRWNPTTTFSVNDRLNIAVKGNNPGRNTAKFVITFKDGNTVYYIDDSVEYPAVLNTSNSYTYFIGSWPLETIPGNYTVEIYVIDANGFQSNTMTASFEVK